MNTTELVKEWVDVSGKVEVRVLQDDIVDQFTHLFESLATGSIDTTYETAINILYLSTRFTLSRNINKHVANLSALHNILIANERDALIPLLDLGIAAIHKSYLSTLYATKQKAESVVQEVFTDDNTRCFVTEVNGMFIVRKKGSAHTYSSHKDYNNPAEELLCILEQNINDLE